jgi:hypothetical protein
MKKLILFLSATVLPGQVAPPPSTIFDQDAVHEIRLTFKQADWYEQLTADYAAARDNTPYREASLVWGQYRFNSVGVRFKGNSSYSGATTKKKPFRIKLNEFVKGQKIDDMDSFGLSNGWNDPSFVREKAYYEMAAKTVLAAPRSNFAALYINNEYWGLYILGEVVNGDFLDHHFAKADGDGNLYKAQNPGANLAYVGEDPAAYQTFFSKESNEDANDWTDLIELARIFSTQRPKPRRTIVFAAFSGEEEGLLGSNYYVNHPVIPLANTVAMINMDMIGRIRDGKVLVSGATNGSAYRKKLQSLGEQYNLALDLDDSGVYGSSDHTSFKTKLVPILFFFSGLHGDYHRPTDTWDKIEAPGAAKLLNLLSEFISTLTNRSLMPRIAESGDANRTEAVPTGSSH